MPFKRAPAFTADQLSGERIPILVSRVASLDVLFLCSLLHQRTNSLKIFFADDWLVMILNKELILFTVVLVPPETKICIAFLKEACSRVFLIFEDSPDCTSPPRSVFLCLQLSVIELPCNPWLLILILL